MMTTALYERIDSIADILLGENGTFIDFEGIFAALA